MRPVVLCGVTSAMDIYGQESLGLAVCLMPIRNDDEAVQIANDTPSRLSAAAFTRDRARGLRIARAIEADDPLHLRLPLFQPFPLFHLFPPPFFAFPPRRD